jgi:SAM-dependent MidA family methyltransferase
VTALAEILAARIRAEGPIRLSDYMAECLLHPAHGYYTTRPPFGAEGDFTTAPEISQMFGELLGLCLAQAWLDQGAPAPFTLAEIGPGRGTLMADVLRATRGVPGFHAAMRVRLVEASPRLRALQAEKLAPYAVDWVDLDALEGPIFLVANEFFDALPIRQFRRAGPGWRETMVGLGESGLAPGLGPLLPIPELGARLADTSEGEIVEICPEAGPILARLAPHLALALIVDYGGWQSRGDTFQALRHHAPCDPFAEPGMADLTAHVDFEALARAAGLPHAYTTQGALLTALGIEARAARLARSLTGAALDSHLAATRRLTSPQEMGTLFKVLALHAPGTPPPPGFPDSRLHP